MIEAFLVVLTIACGAWIGWTAKRVSPLKLLGLSALFFAGAVALYGSWCDSASIIDILFFRDVQRQYLCSGGMTGAGWMLLVAVPVALARLYRRKHAQPHEHADDI